MNHFVTVMSFTYPSEAAVICGRLESEGIICFLKDELTQNRSYGYTSFGGVKLQVKESDLNRAVEILKENKYITENDLQPDKGLMRIYKILSKIPVIKNMLKAKEFPPRAEQK